MKIQITEEDIRNGRPCVGLSCPVAIAFKRATMASYADVTGRCIYARIGNIDLDCVTPESVRDFIDLFDSKISRHLAEPFEFDLDIRLNERC